jgi:hypothetical protein
VYRRQLDLETLVRTRGALFPISTLESRLKCPRRVVLLFDSRGAANSQSRLSARLLLARGRLSFLAQK